MTLRSPQLRLIRTTLLTSGTAGTLDSRTTLIHVEALGGGGGGGGAAGANSNGAGGAGGGAGAYSSIILATTPGAGYTYSIGTAGTAGVAGNNTGGTGGDTTFTYASTVLRAKGGAGGAGMAAGTTLLMTPGGAGGVGTSMAVSYMAGSHNSANGLSVTSVPLATGSLAAGRLIVVIQHMYDGAVASSPEGGTYTLLAEVDRNVGNQIHTYVWGKIATGAETSPISISGSGAIFETAESFILDGTDVEYQTGYIGAPAVGASGDGTAPSVGGLTAVKDGSLALCVKGGYNGVTTSATPAGWSVLAEDVGGVNDVWYRSRNAAEASGTVTLTQSPTDTWTMAQLMFQPGDMSASGEQGGPGMRASGTAYSAGKGGSTRWGSGGVNATVSGNGAAGAAGSGYGAGGSGGAAGNNTNRAGGAGTAGAILLHEYGLF